MENAKQTNFTTAIETATAAFGPAFVANFLGLSKADSKTFYAYLDARISEQPLAVAVAYSILCSIENANDTPERDWDEVFGATLSSYFDDLDMLYSSGLAWGMVGETWQAFALTIRAYDTTGKADKATTLDLAYRGAEIFHKVALRAYQQTPNRWTLADLNETAESLFDLERAIEALQAFDLLEQTNAKKGL